MTLTTTSLATISMKKVLGIAQTDNNKGPGNEAYRTGFSVAGSTVFGGEIPPTPLKTNLYNITTGVEFVRLKMTLDPTSNGHSYYASLPDDYQSLSSNPNKAKPYFANSTKLLSTKGKLQIIPSSFGDLYEANPYSGGTSAKGTGTLIPPGSSRDWVIDAYNGIIFQQTVDTSIDWLECYIWTGDFVTDQITALIAGGGGSSDFIDNTALAADISQFYLIDTYNSANPALSVTQWFVSTENNGSAYTTIVHALKTGTSVMHNTYSSLMIGAKLLTIDVNLDPTTHDVRLLAKPNIAGLTVDIKRLVVN